MTKRNAASASLHEAPQRKKSRSGRDVVHEQDAVHALHAAAPPALFSTLSAQRRSKRPRCCEDEEEETPGHEPGHAPDHVTEETGNVSVSGKFITASGACTCAMTSKDSASASKPEERIQVTRPDDDEDELCAFNSFQYWRPPLPALDLSLLDRPHVAGFNADSSVRDATEEMET